MQKVCNALGSAAYKEHKRNINLLQIRMREIMKKIFMMIAAAFLLMTANCQAAEVDYVLVEASYTVQASDTLQSIAAAYMQKNTYGKREIREFTEGIRELNEQLVTGTVHTGDIIRINYWIKK